LRIIGSSPSIIDSASRVSYYHVGAPTLIRPANKNTPLSEKTSNRTKRYPSANNEKLHPPKCTNSINLFEETALILEYFLMLRRTGPVLIASLIAFTFPLSLLF
jgi:hypothetical protein